MLALASPRASLGDDPAAAKIAFSEASRRFDVGDYEEALKGFKRAYLLFEKAEFLFNIATCHRKLGQVAEAIDFYERYLDKTGDTPDRAEVLKLVDELRTELRRPREAPAPVVAPSPLIAPAPAPPVDAPPAARSHGMRDAGLIAAVAGVAIALGGGIGFGLAADGKAADITAEATHHMPFDPSIDDARGTYRTLAISSWIVGGALAATGVVLLLVGTRGEDAPSRTALAPLLWPGGGGLAIAGAL